jgi:hypothetical protein
MGQSWRERQKRCKEIRRREILGDSKTKTNEILMYVDFRNLSLKSFISSREI